MMAVACLHLFRFRAWTSSVSDFVEQSPLTVTTGLLTFNLGRVASPGTPNTLATSHNSKIWKTEGLWIWISVTSSDAWCAIWQRKVLLWIFLRNSQWWSVSAFNLCRSVSYWDFSVGLSWMAVHVIQPDTTFFNAEGIFSVLIPYIFTIYCNKPTSAPFWQI
jgi:hypothetical protein